MPDVLGRPPRDARFAYVLDDDPQVGTVVRTLLAANGFAPRQFSRPAPFLADLKVRHPELIVLDLSLGDSDAVEVMRHLKSLNYKGKVLLMSGRDEATLNEITQIGERHGLAMLPPLKKPFRAADFKNRVTALAADEALPEVEAPHLAEVEPGAAFRSGWLEVKEAPSEVRHSHGIQVDAGEALRNKWLELWYQPKIDLKSKLVCGAEALMRARHPQHGIISPKDLFPPSGDPLYHPLSKFVVERAMADWRRFADAGIALKLAVNMPVSVIQAPDFVGMIRRWLPTDPKFPGLIIEVTEDEIIQDTEWVREVAAQLKLYNVSISIDDFGSAYASLSRLSELPCIELKLDRGFVLDCSANKTKRDLCQTVVDLGHRFHASVCAEGVETRDDLQVLIDMGCDTAQGFLFAKPMAAEDFTKTVLKAKPPSTPAQTENDPAVS